MQSSDRPIIGHDEHETTPQKYTSVYLPNSPEHIPVGVPPVCSIASHDLQGSPGAGTVHPASMRAAIKIALFMPMAGV